MKSPQQLSVPDIAFSLIHQGGIKQKRKENSFTVKIDGVVVGTKTHSSAAGPGKTISLPARRLLQRGEDDNSTAYGCGGVWHASGLRPCTCNIAFGVSRHLHLGLRIRRRACPLPLLAPAPLTAHCDVEFSSRKPRGCRWGRDCLL